ncbi:hypothetical protein CsatB_004779 [Cannabis sativa]
MASPQIVGNSFYKIFPYNSTRIESTNSVFLIHLFANFTRHSLSMEASTTFTNVVVLFRDTLMNNSTDAKVILEKSLAEVHLPSSVFPVIDEIINYGRKMWNDKDRNLSVRVDVDVFVDELPSQPMNDNEGYYDEDDDGDSDGDVDGNDAYHVYDMTDIHIRFVAASEQSIERLEKDLIKDGQVISCSVCFENIVVGLEATKLTCGHRYHEECIVKWLQTSKFCPLCRSEVA